MISESELLWGVLFGSIGLGLSIRNVFGLHDADSKLLRDCGSDNPDDASVVIIKALWNKLKHDV